MQHHLRGPGSTRGKIYQSGIRCLVRLPGEVDMLFYLPQRIEIRHDPIRGIATDLQDRLQPWALLSHIE